MRISRFTKLAAHPLAQGALSGILLALAYPPVDLWPLAFVGLIPLFFVAARPDTTLRLRFGAGFVGGLIFFGITLRWILAAHPLAWAGVNQTWLSITFVTLIYTTMVAVLAGLAGLFVPILARLSHTANSYPRLLKPLLALLLPPALWVLVEYLRAWGYGLFWWGPEGLIGPHWTFGNLGYALHGVAQLRMLAGIGGMYLLSFLVATVNVILFWALKRQEVSEEKNTFARIIGVLRDNKDHAYRLQLLTALLIGIGAWVFAGALLLVSSAPAASSRQTTAAVVTTAFPAGYTQNLKASLVAKRIVLDALDAALLQHPDLIVFPEGTDALRALAEREGTAEHTQEFFRLRTGGTPTVIIDSALIPVSPSASRSRLWYLDTEKGFVGFYDKRFLIPGGEYMPEVIKSILTLVGRRDVVLKFASIRRRVPGTERDTVVETRNAKIGGLVCSGIIAPDLARGMVKNGAELLVVVSSDSIFRGHRALLAQNEAMSQIRAVELDRTFVQATNGGRSYVVDRVGRVVAETTDPVMTVRMTLQQHKTVYARFGDWILWVAAVLVTVAVVRQARKIRIRSKA